MKIKKLNENLENVDIENATPVENLPTASAKEGEKKAIERTRSAVKEMEQDMEVDDKGYIRGKFAPKETKKVSSPDLKKMKLSEDLFEEADESESDKFHDVCNSLNVYTATADGGEEFYIFDSWTDVNELYSKMGWEKTGDYDTEKLDEITDDNWGFSDEYEACYHCGKLIHTQPDSYSWKPDFFVDYEVGEIVCGDCVRENPSDYINHLANNPDAANTILSSNDLMSAGFRRVTDDEFENGWYGQADSPQKILDNALEENPNGTFIFSITDNQQFATRFELWELDEFAESLDESVGAIAKTSAVFIAKHWKEILEGLEAAGVAYETIKGIIDKIKEDDAKDPRVKRKDASKPQEPVTEGIEETEVIKRYSDVVPQEDRRYWYFTTHGTGPGTIPKDLNVLDVKYNLPNLNGTIGDYICLDGILNTSELNMYDLKELTPGNEDEITNEELKDVIETSTGEEVDEGLLDGIVNVASGAITGAKIGSAVGHPVAGAVIGGIAGGEKILDTADNSLHVMSGLRDKLGSGPVPGIDTPEQQKLKDAQNQEVLGVK